jgi:hypothetical protein
MKRNDGKKRKPRVSVQGAKHNSRELQKWTAHEIAKAINIPDGKDEAIESRPMGQAGVDVILHGEAKRRFPFAVECKHGQNIGWQAAVKQAKEAQKKAKYPFWLVVMKALSFKRRFVLVDAEVFFNIYKEAITRVDEEYGERNHEKIQEMLTGEK